MLPPSSRRRLSTIAWTASADLPKSTNCHAFRPGLKTQTMKLHPASRCADGVGLCIPYAVNVCTANEIDSSIHPIEESVGVQQRSRRQRNASTDNSCDFRPGRMPTANHCGDLRRCTAAAGRRTQSGPNASGNQTTWQRCHRQLCVSFCPEQNPQTWPRNCPQWSSFPNTQMRASCCSGFHVVWY